MDPIDGICNPNRKPKDRAKMRGDARENRVKENKCDDLNLRRAFAG